MRSFVAPAVSRARTAAFLLTAVLLLALSVGAGRAAADDPNMNGGDGRVVAQAFDAAGNLYMVSQTPAHGLAVTVNYASNNSWNGPLINYVPTNNVYSTPAMLFDTDGSLFIAYQGPGHTLMVMSRWASDGQWHGPNQIENVNSVYSTPSIVKAPWGDIFVTYQGPNNSLVTSVRQSSDGTWHKYPVMGSSTTYSSPAQSFVNYADGAHLLISAVGIDRRLVVTDRWVDGTWHGPYDQGGGAGVAFSAPNMVTGKDSTLRIGFEGPNHSYSEITKTMTAWSAPVSRAGGTVFSAPSQLVDSGGNIYVAWQGPGHSLYEFVRYAIDGSWNGPNNLVNTPNITYWAPTQIYNKTTGRITISMQGTNNKLVTLVNGSAWTKLDTQISNNVSTGDKYWPTSAQYGGEDGHVNTSAEADAVAAAYQGAATEAAARQILTDLDPADLPLVEFSLRNSIHEGDLVANLDNSKIYLFTGSRLHYLDFSIGHDILHADAEMNAAKRMTTGSLSTITEANAVGPYKTSWDSGGLDRVVNTRAEADAVGALEDTSSPANRPAIWAGLSSAEQASYPYLNPAYRYTDGDGGALASIVNDDPDSTPVASAAGISAPPSGPNGWCRGGIIGLANGTTTYVPNGLSHLHTYAMWDFAYSGVAGNRYSVGLAATTYDCSNGYSRSYIMMQWDGMGLPCVVDAVTPIYQVKMVRFNGQEKPWKYQGNIVNHVYPCQRQNILDSYVLRSLPFQEMAPLAGNSGSMGRMKELRLLGGVDDGGGFGKPFDLAIPMHYDYHA
jgi:hypothetical protein